MRSLNLIRCNCPQLLDKLRQRWLLATTITMVLPCIWLCSLAVANAGWRFNWTHSMPLGFYQLVPTQGQSSITKGALVEFCPPDWVTPAAFAFYPADPHGRCKGGGTPLFKRVMAVAGDTVAVSSTATVVNGVPILHSGQLDKASLPKQSGVFTLQSGEFWVHGEGANPELAAYSFDSRYYGVIPLASIRAYAAVGQPAH